METKKFTKFTIATIKRTAQNVYPLVRKKEKLMEVIANAQQEIEQLKAMIDTYQTPIKMATGGYTTEDLINRVVTVTDKLDKEGNPIKMTQYVLKYPDTVVPPTVEDTSAAENTSDSTEKDTYNEVMQEEIEAKADDNLPF